jgi:hypothetical protein
MEVIMKFFGNKKAVNGRLVKLANKNKKAVESEFYFALWVENKFDNDERCLLFSQSDLNKIQDVKYCDFEPQMDLGKLYRMGNAESYFVKIKDLDNNEKIVRLNSTVMGNGTRRAKKNPEDVPEKGFLQDLLD